MARYVTAAKELLHGFDKKDHLVGGLLLAVSVGILGFREELGVTLSFSGMLGIAIIFLTYYQLKGRSSGSYPDYPHPRPTFSKNEEGPPQLGLRNFGGPALNLSIYGRITIRDEAVSSRRGLLNLSIFNSPTDDSVHEGIIVSDSETANLRNNEFISLAKKDFDELFEPESLDDHEDGQLELYYSFEAVSGRYYPRGYNRNTSIAHIADNHSGPRTVQIEEIINRRDNE